MTGKDNIGAPRCGALIQSGQPRALASLGCRFPALDLLRVVAILAAISCHTLPGELQQRLWKDLPMVAFMGSLFILSGALLLPVSESLGVFFRKRLKRVFIPLAIWSVIYAAVYYFQGERTLLETAKSFRDILFRSTFPPGWFCYAIGGIYLFAPIISPWLRQAERRQIEIYLLIWLVSLNMPYFGFTSDIGAGLFAMFYNCMGYAIMGVYLVYYGIPAPPSWRVWLPALILLTAYPFYTRVHNGWQAYADGFYITPNCAEAALGTILFIIFWQMFGGWKQAEGQNSNTVGDSALAGGFGTAARLDSEYNSLNVSNNSNTQVRFRKTLNKILCELSLDSFGLYLIHWLFVFHILYPYFPGWHPSWATFLLTIAVCLPAAALLRRIPRLGPYLM